MSDERDDPFGRRDDPPALPGDWLPPASAPKPPAPPAWAAPESPAQAPGAPGGGAHQSPPGAAAPPAGGSSGKATAALVLGICGLIVCPLICSVLALVLGYQARNEIDRGGGQSNRSSAVAGIVLGWVGVALGVLLIVALILLGVEGSVEVDTTPENSPDFSMLRAGFALAIGPH
jgi:hypothetical protein